MKKSRGNSTKKILIIILALVIGSFIGYRFALAQSGNALKSVVEPGSMTTEASYIIFTDGSTVYARNGTTGEIEFSGTNASQIIQNAINALTNGGKIFIKSGTYNLGNVGLTFNITSNEIDFEGENRGKTILQYNGSGNAIYMQGGPSNHYSTLENFAIDCMNKTNGATGLYVDAIIGRYLILEEIYVGNAGTGIWIHDTNGIVLKEPYAYDCTNGITADKGVHSEADELFIQNPRIIGCDVGLNLLSKGTSQIIQGGTISDCDTGIYVEDSSNLLIQGVHFESQKTVEINLNGFNEPNPLLSATLSNLYMRSIIPIAIRTNYVEKLTIENCRSLQHTTAFLNNTRDANIILKNNRIEDPSLATNPLYLYRLKDLFIPFGYTDTSTGIKGNYSVAILPNGTDKSVYCSFSVPSDFAAIYTFYAVVIPDGASGNVHSWAYSNYGAASQSYNNYSSMTGDFLDPVTSNMLKWKDMDGKDLLSNVTAGSFVGIRFRRQGDGFDTLAANLDVAGFILSYYSKEAKLYDTD